MTFKRRTDNAFSVIGKEGSTDDGDGFIKNLWDNGLELAGAAYDFRCPITQKDYIFFPIRRI